ncbi:MAG: hypothetical protein ABIG89_05305 [Candidatus Woesearchaeota archaeon]
MAKKSKGKVKSKKAGKIKISKTSSDSHSMHMLTIVASVAVIGIILMVLLTMNSGKKAVVSDDVIAENYINEIGAEDLAYDDEVEYVVDEIGAEGVDEIGADEVVDESAVDDLAGEAYRSRVKCTDSDNGNKPYVKGVSSGINAYTGKIVKNYPDQCTTTAVNARGMTYNLIESYCYNNKLYSIEISCTSLNSKFICHQGRCLEPECHDSDGTNPEKAGTYSGFYSYDGTFREGTEECVTNQVNAAGDYFMTYEYYCSNNILYSSTKSCKSDQICKDGRCVKK